MKNKHIISTFVFVFLLATSNKCFAEQNLQFSQNVMPMNPVSTQKVDAKSNIQPPKHFSKEEMENKKAEFEKRLNLTEEQKTQIEINKQKDKEKIKPIIDKLHQKKIDYMSLESNSELDEVTKTKQKFELKNEIRELKLQADNCRRENMQSFEALLTDEQKIEFEKIKTEQRQEMEKRKQERHKKFNSQNKIRPKLF